MKTITNPKELYSFIIESYNKESTELNSLYFDVNVTMTEKDILETYRYIQEDINGDEVYRLNNDGSIAEIFIHEGEFNNIYTGNCMDYLKTFNDKNIFARYCYGDLSERLDFIL